MRKYIVLLIINLIFVVLQDSFFMEFFGNGYNPNLIIALSYVFVLLDNDSTATTSMFIGGLLLSMLNTGIVGLSLFALVVVLQISIYVRKAIFKSVFVQVIFILINVTLFKIATSMSLDLVFKDVFISGLVTIIFTFLFYLITRSFSVRYKSFEYRIKA